MGVLKTKTRAGRIAIRGILDKTKSRWWLAVLALLVGVLAWRASVAVGTGAASGRSIEGVAGAFDPNRTTFRLATFNIHGCKGGDGRRDVQRVADCLGNLDFVGLNEVHGRSLFLPQNQAQTLGERLGRAWLFAPASRRWYHRDFGNGLITTLPVQFWQSIPLPDRSGKHYRNVVLVDLTFRRTTIHALVTHLVHGDVVARRQQLEAVIELFLAMGEPAVLLGDLNSHPDDPQIRQLLQIPGVSDPVGELVNPPPSERIDWIIIRQLRGVAAGVVDQGASDHPLYWVELELPPPK